MIIGTIKGQELICTSRKIVDKSVDYLTAEFVFSTSEWNGLTKIAYFNDGENVYPFVLENDKITAEKHLNLKAGSWKLCVWGFDTDVVDLENIPNELKRITTDECEIIVEKTGETGTEIIPILPATLGEQILAKAMKAVETAQSVRDDADAGKFDGFSPIVKIEPITDGYRLTITDKIDTYAINILNGISPTINIFEIENGHRIVIDDATGEKQFDILNGEKGEAGIGVKSVKVNDEAEIIVEYDDGRKENAGLARLTDLFEAQVDENGDLILNIYDYEAKEEIELNVGNVKGVGIETIRFERTPVFDTEDLLCYIMRVYYTNKTSEAFNVFIPKGEDGISIVNVKINEENHLICTLSNGTEIDAGSVGGSGGTTNYNDLENKPKINGVELKDNKTLDDLGIDIPTKVSQLENDEEYLTKDTIPTDDGSITRNENDDIQAVGVVLGNTSEDEVQFFRKLTKAEFDEIEEKRNDTLYEVIDDEDKALFEVDGETIEFAEIGDEEILRIPDKVDLMNETRLFGNGESGYRKYRNGFIEQWGVATTLATGETEFTMHYAHIDMNFSIFVEPREMGNFFHYAIPSGNKKFKCRIQSKDSVSMAIKFQWRSIGRWK